MVLEDLPTEEDAVLLGEEMLREGIFSVHSKKDKPFIANDKAFFRFSEQFFYGLGIYFIVFIFLFLSIW